MFIYRPIFSVMISLLSVQLWASTSFDKDWSLTSDSDNVKVWQLNSNPDVTGSWQERSPSKKLDWSKVGSDAFFKALEADKVKMLSFVGISEWKPEQYKWNKHPKGHELKIEGHYLDSQNKKIAFTEVYYFQELKTIQILQTRPFSTSGKFTDDFFTFIKDQLPK